MEELCGRFEDAVESGEAVNLKYAYTALSWDIIYEYCCSRTLGSVAMADFNKGYVDLLEKGFHMTPIVSLVSDCFEGSDLLTVECSSLSCISWVLFSSPSRYILLFRSIFPDDVKFHD